MIIARFLVTKFNVIMPAEKLLLYG